MEKPRKEEIIRYFGSILAAASFMDITTQGLGRWPDGRISEPRYRHLLGSFVRHGKRIPREFRPETEYAN